MKRWKDLCGVPGKVSASKQSLTIKKGEEIKPEDFEDPQEYFDSEPERSERTVEPENFDYSRMKKPGIYRDGTYYDEEDSVDEGYTIIVPYANLNPKICNNHIEKLNRKFDRNFRLKVDNKQKYPIADLKRMKAIVAKKDLDQETKDSILKLIRDLSENINKG